MKPMPARRSSCCLALVLALLASAPLCHATQSAARLEKHARKIEKKLAKYPAGTYLHLAFRDSPDSLGTLGHLSATSFTFTNADSNAVETHDYADVARVEKGETFIGAGSTPARHFRLWIPAMISAGAAAAAVAVLR